MAKDRQPNTSDRHQGPELPDVASGHERVAKHKVSKAIGHKVDRSDARFHDIAHSAQINPNVKAALLRQAAGAGDNLPGSGANPYGEPENPAIELSPQTALEVGARVESVSGNDGPNTPGCKIDRAMFPAQPNLADIGPDSNMDGSGVSIADIKRNIEPTDFGTSPAGNVDGSGAGFYQAKSKDGSGVK